MPLVSCLKELLNRTIFPTHNSRFNDAMLGQRYNFKHGRALETYGCQICIGACNMETGLFI
jgi:hypothetical protein